MTAKRLVLKDNHPTMIRFNKLCQVADELGLRISFHGQAMVLEDLHRENLPPLMIEDIEEDHTHTWCADFPPGTEVKLVYDNPVYLEEKRKEQEERDRKYHEEQRLAQEKRLAAEEAERKRVERETEAQDRKLFAELKAKYEGT